MTAFSLAKYHAAERTAGLAFTPLGLARWPNVWTHIVRWWSDPQT
jgi:hypothetical protein